ncbi:MAG: ATP-binding protein [Candidatus Gallimonas sp.]
MYFEIDDFNALERALHTLCDRLTASDVPEETVFDSKLVACELLSNVLQHGGERAYCYATVDGDRILISVRGENGFRPPDNSACSDVTAECGRGLYLVDAMCESRDYDERDGIRVVIKIIR